METYEWQRNKAITDRMYYSERIFQTTTFFAGAFTALNLLLMNKGMLADEARRKIPRYWMWWGGINAVCLFVLLKPLHKDELRIHWKKRRTMGKYLYSLYHLEDE